MMLTKEQREWLKKELEIAERLFDAKTASKCNNGIMRDIIRIDALKLITEMHNVAMTKHNADYKAEQERKARVEAGKERLNETKSDSSTI